MSNEYTWLALGVTSAAIGVTLMLSAYLPQHTLHNTTVVFLGNNR